MCFIGLAFARSSRSRLPSRTVKIPADPGVLLASVVSSPASARFPICAGSTCSRNSATVPSHVVHRANKQAGLHERFLRAERYGLPAVDAALRPAASQSGPRMRPSLGAAAKFEPSKAGLQIRHPSRSAMYIGLGALVIILILILLLT